MLTADAFGVLPPIARLTPSQAMYHFLSGYTAKVAGTEKGMGNEPEGDLLDLFRRALHAAPSERLRQSAARPDRQARCRACWLVNTGWTGGKFGTGSRMPIQATRALLNAALSGNLQNSAMRVDPMFGFEVPVALEGVDPAILDPRQTWADPAAYDEQAKALIAMFNANFEKFSSHVDADVLQAGPALQEAAE